MKYPDLLEIPLASIEVGTDRARELEPAWAEALAMLISAQGLLTPITLRPIEGAPSRYRLVAGLHRLEGFRILGHDAIPAYLSGAESDDAARLEEVMENLGRYDLNALDRCHHLFELKRLHELKYPQAKHGGDHRSIKGQTLPLGTAEREAFGFSAVVAEKVGLSARSIRLAVKIWTDLDPAVRSRLHGTVLADKQTELKALSEQPPALQAKILNLILNEAHPTIQNVAGALELINGGTVLTPLERQYRTILTGMKSLPDESLDRLLAENADRVLASLKRQGRI